MDPPAPVSQNAIGIRSALRLLLLTAGCVALLFIAWIGRAIVLLLIASCIVAVLLSAAVDWLAARLRMKRSLAFALLLSGASIAIIVTLWSLGPGIIEQVADLQADLPRAIQQLLEHLRTYPGLAWLLAQGAGYAQTSGTIASALSRIEGVVLSTASIIGGLGVVLFLGIYLAAEPQVYLSGVRRLIPKGVHERFDACTRNAATVLRWWMMSQLFSMVAVGIIVTIGLWALSIPLAGTLGILAALLTFIPNVGPILSVVPAVLLALSISPAKGALVVFLYLLVHFLEGNIITPFLERRIVRLPPALTLTAQLLAAVVAGPLGVALAAPLTAITIGLLQVLVPEN